MSDDMERDEAGLRRLPLHDEHVRLGARMTPFAGWLMPTVYSSIIGEHLHVRRHAGLFDVSHMGKLMIRGWGAVQEVGRLVAGDLSRLRPGEARYTVLLTAAGGIQDDLIAYRESDGLLLIVNAALLAHDREWLLDQLPPDVTVDDLTEITCLLALQGPEARTVLSRLLEEGSEAPEPFTFIAARLAGAEVTLMGTGYTGEDGVEILVSVEDAQRVWTALASQPEVRPAGLAARDTLRLEAALLLNTQDMTITTTPYEARLAWLVDLERPDFVGREALLAAGEAGPRRLLVGLATQARLIPRTGTVLMHEGADVGVVTSGSFSPVLGHPIALGYVVPQYAEEGTELVARVRGRDLPMTVVKRPFYKRGLTPVPPEEAA